MCYIICQIKKVSFLILSNLFYFILRVNGGLGGRGKGEREGERGGERGGDEWTYLIYVPEHVLIFMGAVYEDQKYADKGEIFFAPFFGVFSKCYDSKSAFL